MPEVTETLLPNPLTNLSETPPVIIEQVRPPKAAPTAPKAAAKGQNGTPAAAKEAQAPPAGEPAKEPEKAPETPPTEPKPAEEPEKAARTAHLISQAAREDARLRQERQSLRAEREAFKADQAAAAKAREEYAAYEAAKKQAKLNPAKWLEIGGVSFEDAARFYVGDQKPEAAVLVEERLREAKEAQDKELAALRADIEGERTRAAQSEEQRVALDFQAKIGAVLESGGDKYALIKEFNCGPDVWDTIVEHWDRQMKEKKPPEEMRLLPIDTAADLVESVLRDQAKRAAKHVAKDLGLIEAPAPAAAPTPEAKRASGVQLTNAVVASPSAQPEGRRRLPSREEAIEASTNLLKSLRKK